MYDKEKASKYSQVWPNVLKDLKSGMKVADASRKHDMPSDSIAKRWQRFRKENGIPIKPHPITKQTFRKQKQVVSVDLKTPKVAIILASPENLKSVLENLL